MIRTKERLRHVWSQAHGTGKINCGQIRKATKCQANEFGLGSSEAALDYGQGNSMMEVAF